MNPMSHDEKSDFSTVCDNSPMSKFSQLVGNNDSSNARAEEVGIAMPHFPQKLDQESVDRLFLNVVSPPFQDECIEAKNRKKCMFSMESFELLRKYGSRRLKQEGKSPSTNCEMSSDQISSTEMTIRLAADKFIQSTNGRSSDLSMLNQPYPTYLLPHCGENSEGVGLIQNLLLCAEKVADNQYERALKFLKDCDKKSLSNGTPIQRLVFYFSQALFEKIANETGRIFVRDLEENNADPIESVLFPSMNLLISFHKEHPLSQMTKLVGVQVILDHVEGSRKVHVINLQIRSGVQWIILMQDLAARTEHPIQLLKITAIRSKRESTMEEMGRQLAFFAHSLNLNFTFKTVTVDDFSDLNITLFDLDADESVAVYAPYILSVFVGRINELDHLMRTMENMNPCVMIVTELEVNCNSPSFVERFVESLFFYGAFFDSLEDCFKNDETSRANAESSWFGSGIRNILAADGDQRRLRHVNVSVWRAFLARFEVSEMELSTSSVDQARIGVQSLGCGRSCTLYKDGKCLVIGWKGTPLSVVSAWKF